MSFTYHSVPIWDEAEVGVVRVDDAGSSHIPIVIFQARKQVDQTLWTLNNQFSLYCLSHYSQ